MNRSPRSISRFARRVAWLPFLVLACVRAAAPLAAQIPAAAQVAGGAGDLYEVRLADGSVLFGRFVAVEGTRVVLVTQGGVRLELERAQIGEARPVRGTVQADGEIWPEDPNRTRLFFGPTGRGLRAGQGYAGAFEAAFPFVAVGLSDRITIAGGTPIVPDWMGQVWYLAPRLQLVDHEKVQLSASALAFFDFSDEQLDPFGLMFGAASFGSTGQSLTIGAGWGFSGDDVTNEPGFLLGGEARIHRNVKLITENYYMSLDGEDLLLAGAGIRIFGERLTGDFGLGFGGGAEDFGCCMPLINLVYNFGER